MVALRNLYGAKLLCIIYRSIYLEHQFVVPTHSLVAGALTIKVEQSQVAGVLATRGLLRRGYSIPLFGEFGADGSDDKTLHQNCRIRGLCCAAPG